MTWPPIGPVNLPRSNGKLSSAPHTDSSGTRGEKAPKNIGRRPERANANLKGCAATHRYLYHDEKDECEFWEELSVDGRSDFAKERARLPPSPGAASA